MFRGTNRYWSLLALLLAVNLGGLYWVDQRAEASARDDIRVLKFSPSGEAPRARSMSVEFDKPVVAASDTHRTLDVSPFTIAPTVEGRWAWTKQNVLEFRFEKPLVSGRLVKVDLTSDGESLLGKTLVGPRHFEFSTGPLRWERSEIVAVDPKHVTFELTFDQPILTEELLQRISIDDGSGRPLEVEALEREADSTVVLRTRRPSDGRLEIYLSHDLCGRDGEISLGVHAPWTLGFPKGFGLISSRIKGTRRGQKAEMVLTFSDSLSQDISGAQVVLDPEVPDLVARVSGGNLILEGSYEPNARYVVSFGPDIWSRDGQSLERRTSKSFTIPSPLPELWFPQDRGQLSPRGNLLFDVGLANVSRMSLSASRVHTNNIVSHVQGGGEWRTSRILGSKEIDLGTPISASQIVPLDLSGLLDDPLGVYRIEARSDDDGHWLSDSALITISDLGISSKEHNGTHHVWITSLRTGRPIQGVRVHGYSQNNQKRLSVITDERGLATLRCTPNHPDGDVWLLVAESGRDINYLCPSRDRWPSHSYPSFTRDHSQDYEAYLYTDRGLFRPGEELHLAGVLRSKKGSVPGGFPVELEIKRPDDTRMAPPRLTQMDLQGVFAETVGIPTDAPLGLYEITARIPGMPREVARETFLVDCYTPDRFEMNLSSEDPQLADGKSQKVHVHGQYLFGVPASGFGVSGYAQFQRVPYPSKAFARFFFGSSEEEGSYSSEKVLGSLDQGGDCILSLDLPDELASGYYRVPIHVTLTEPGARSLSRSMMTTLPHSKAFVGLCKLEGDARSSLPWNEPVSIEWVLVDANDSLTLGESMEFTVEKIERDWVQEEHRSSWRWVMHEWSTEIHKWKEDAAEGTGITQVPALSGGDYRLYAHETGSGDSSSLALTVLNKFGQASAAKSRPGVIHLAWDRESYAPGDLAVLSLESDVMGVGWICLEGDGLLLEEIVDMSLGRNEVRIPVPISLRGGALLSAMVVAPVDPDALDWNSHRSRGTIRLETNHSSSRLAATLMVPQVASPGESIEITFETNGNQTQSVKPTVHLFAVDDGILALSDEKSPDPLEYFFAPRRSSVWASDVFSDLLPDHDRARPSLSIGGDLGVTSRRGDALRDIAPAIIWEDPRSVDEEGRAHFQWKVPDMVGRLRLMAIVVDDDLYGSVSCPLEIKSSVLLEMPSHLTVAPGDRFNLPVRVLNTKEEATSLELSWSVSEIRQQEETSAKQIDIAKQGSFEFKVPLTLEHPGKALIEVLVRDLVSKEEFSRRAEVHVRPIQALTHVAWNGSVGGGFSSEWDPRRDMLFSQIQEPESVKLMVSGSPSVFLTPALEYLLEYPHGCVEQTTSRLWALLAAREINLLAQEAGPWNELVDETESMMNAGFARLWSMQNSQGMMGYWPGDVEVHPWGTLYAARFLLHASSRGVDFDRRLIDPLVDGIHRWLSDRSKQFDHGQKVSACLVLALADKPHRGWMTRLFEERNELKTEDCARLARAWMRLGDPGRAISLMKSFRANQNWGHSMDPVTPRPFVLAECLDALMDIDFHEPRIPSVVMQLEKLRNSNGHWGSTYANGRVISALARYQGSLPPQNFRATLDVDDESYPLTQDSMLALDLKSIPNRLRLRVEGEGSAFISVTSRGWSKEGAYEVVDEGLRVRSSFADPKSGEPMDLQALKIGDLIQANVELSSREGMEIPYVAIVMMLPGGIEVDRPRLSIAAKSDKSGPRLPERYEFLDDRVLLFDTARADSAVYRFNLRVTGEGEFAVPPIQASCMYNEAIRSISGEHVTMKTSR